MTGSAPGDGGELRAECVCVDRGGRRLLHDIDLLVPSGSSTVLTGPSGSGKTVLLLVLAGRIPPSEGRVRLGGRPVGTDEGGGRVGIGLVLEHQGLVAGLTAAENVALPLQVLGASRSAIGERVAEVLSGVDLTRQADRLVDELSGGQRQRVGVARALIGSPPLVLADEPTSEQDPEHRSRVLGQLGDGGRTVVIASNDPEVAAVCDRVVELRDGRVVDDHGTTEAAPGP